MIDQTQPGLSKATLFDLCTEIVLSYPCIKEIRLYTGVEVPNYLVFILKKGASQNELTKLHQETESTFGDIYEKILPKYYSRENKKFVLKYWSLAIDDGAADPFIADDSSYIELYPGNPYKYINIKNLASWTKNLADSYDRVPVESAILYRYYSKSKIFHYEKLKKDRDISLDSFPRYLVVFNVNLTDKGHNPYETPEQHLDRAS